jgi:glycosyltransferase involved in cell wall biosynthesis
LEKQFDVFYLVADKILAEKLMSNNSKVAIFSTHTFVNQIKETRIMLLQEKPDIVLFNGGNAILFPPFLQNKQIKKVTIRHSTNCYAVCRVPNIQRLYRNLYSCLLHIAYFFCDAVIHVSEYSMKEQKLFRKKAICIYNGLPDIIVSERKLRAPVRFLFLGRTDTSKGIDVIAEAFQKIPDDVAEIDIVGTGAYVDNLRCLNKRNIHYHGFQTDTRKYYQNNDVFILLSKFENCPFAVIDAMRYAMPIITTGVGGVAEMVFDGVNGLIIPKTTEALIATVEKLTKNPEIILEMGRKSRQLFEKDFRLEKTIAQLIQTIDKL